MLNLIVYEDDKLSVQKNIKAINVALANYEVDYRILKFDHYDDKLSEVISSKDCKKIYILDIEMKGVSGLELASLIREDDFDSIIIFVTAYDKYHNDVFYNRLMVLDFICKYDGYEGRLKDAINDALKIIYNKNTFVFKYNHVVYRIPYSHINYIEKEPLIKRCLIHTINNNFYVVNSIERLTKMLGCSFVRSHQSCIINMCNVDNVDFVNNVVVFRNGDKTSLLTDKMKKVVKEHVSGYK